MSLIFTFYVFYLGTIEWVSHLRWPDRNNWANSDRNPLVVKGIIEGYVQKLNRFGLYWINRSGHMVNIKIITLV